MTFRNIEISEFKYITVTQYSRIITYTICRIRFRNIRTHYSITNITTILLAISVKIWQMLKKIVNILLIYSKAKKIGYTFSNNVYLNMMM